MTLKQKKYNAKQPAKKAAYERKRKAVRKEIRATALAEFMKVKPEERKANVLTLFTRFVRLRRRSIVAQLVAKREARAKELAKARKEKNAKKNS